MGVGENGETLGTLCNARWVVKWYSHSGVSSEKINIDLAYDPAIPLLAVYSQRMESMVSKRYVHIAVRSGITHNSQMGEATHVSMSARRTHKVCYVHAAFKRKGIPTHPKHR